MLLGNVGVVYGFLLAVTAVLALELVADVPDDAFSVAVFIVIAFALLGSGVYWTQAAIAVAVEQARVGGDPSIGRTIVRGARRANALSAALALVLVVGSVTCAFVFPLLLAGRVTMVAPALVLEDRRVLGAFRRSWQLTAGRTRRNFGLVLLTGVLLVVAPLALAAAAGSVYGVLLPGWLAATAAAATYVTSFVVVLTWLGTAWPLVYQDARRSLPAGGRR